MNDSVNTTLFIGGQGWDHDAWVGDYYPEDLPPEWRLSFYANEYSAVLVPWVGWAAGRAEAQRWLDDTPEGFRFVLEVAADCPDLGAELRAMEPLRPRISALLVCHGDAVVGEAAPLATVRELSNSYPLCLELEQPHHLSPTQRVALKVNDAGIAWQPELPADVAGPVPVGLVAGDAIVSPRTLRTVVEDFMTFATGCPQAMLFFRGQPPRIDNLVTAQTIATLLGH